MDCKHINLIKLGDLQQNSDDTLYCCQKCQDMFTIKPYEIEIQFGTQGVGK